MPTRSLTRREMLGLTAAAGLAGVGYRGAVAAQGPYWPSASAWQTRTPRDLGIDQAGLDNALSYAADHRSTGVVVLRGGRIVAEKYWTGWTEDTAEPIFSSSKSIAAILVGMAIDDHKIKSLDQTASDFVPAWKGTPKAAITLRHMLTMTSGIRNAADTGVSADVDAFERTAALPLDHAPGEVWAYNTNVYRMLLHLLENATGESIDAFTARKLSGPLGMSRSTWDCSPAPNGRTNCTWYRSNLRDMSRFGLFMLRNGSWNGRPIISESFVKDAIHTSQPLNQSYGYLWWLNGKASYRLPGTAGQVREGMLWPDCPPDAYGALGARDKKIYIVPSLDLVVARHGAAAEVAGGANGGRLSFDNELLGRVCRSVRG